MFLLGRLVCFDDRVESIHACILPLSASGRQRADNDVENLS
jgi:hypothetical protein